MIIARYVEGYGLLCFRSVVLIVLNKSEVVKCRHEYAVIFIRSTYFFAGHKCAMSRIGVI
jgi:hypothetical protein